MSVKKVLSEIPTTGFKNNINLRGLRWSREV